jgi:hypothetical protein
MFVFILFLSIFSAFLLEFVSALIDTHIMGEQRERERERESEIHRDKNLICTDQKTHQATHTHRGVDNGVKREGKGM